MHLCVCLLNSVDEFMLSKGLEIPDCNASEAIEKILLNFARAFEISS